MDQVAYCKIFPSIGIARLGDSPEHFVGPEAPSHVDAPPQGYKDPLGRIKRQGARFRLYAFDAQDNVLGEFNLTDPKAHVEWSVELANLKAAWYRFDGVQQGMKDDKAGDPKSLRNKAVQDRSKLSITPSKKVISGADMKGHQFLFDDGCFFDKSVYLGELLTDDQGRLIVLGGHGQSAKTEHGRPLNTYANNDYWHDDVSDGPVSAVATLDGKQIEVRGTAWVIVAPPKFAPNLMNLITLYDVLKETCNVPVPAEVSFARHIYPILQRATSYQWVNSMGQRGHAPGNSKGGSFLDPDFLSVLADNSPSSAPIRSSVFGRLRNPGQKAASQANYSFMPLLSGDEGDATIGDPTTWLYLLPSQYASMEKWAAGQFVSDLKAKPQTAVPFAQIEIKDQPAALTRAALEYCVGGPFFPGIELTYVARYSEWFEEPFRFKQNMFHAGDMTKRMAVPWQADFYECNTHWWPIQRPDDVLNVETYEAALADPGYRDDMRNGVLAGALSDRIAWDRGIGDGFPSNYPGEPGDNDMVEKWKTRGFILPKVTSAGEVLYVEEGISRYDFLQDRDYFYYLLNLDSYPDFLPKAKQLAQKFISDAVELIDKRDSSLDDPNYQLFAYTPEAFGQRLDEIYMSLQIYAQQDPLADPDNAFKSAADVTERIRQYAPLNQLDGAWIRNVAHIGPIDRVTANLFDVWMDEMGDGNPEQNHSNVYTQLMAKVGVQLDPVYSRDYADNPDMLDSAFTVPMYELAISQFTPTFFPEILGMTLQLEWEVLSTIPTIKIFQHYGIDPHFYELHVGIDNAADGHGAKARQAVEWYLDEARARGGDAEVQQLWKRIWSGYVAFGTTGNLASDLDALLKQRVTSPPTPADKIADLIQSKKHYGSLNHRDRTLGPDLINDLFEDPEAFMQALIDNKYIVPGSVASSPFFQAISFNGPMYKVFSDDEIRLWEEWVESLVHHPKPKPQPGPTPVPVPVNDLAGLMVRCVDQLRAVQNGNPAHDTNMLSGPDPNHPGQQITQPVSAWFLSPSPVLMGVISDPANGWIVKGSSGASRFVTQLLADGNAMSAAFSAKDSSSGKTWKQIVTEWIDGGCPMPSVTARMASPATHALSSPPIATVSRKANKKSRKLLGIGSVH